jgi:hypothetical protein
MVEKNFNSYLLICGIIALSFIGCSPSNDSYRKTVQSGIKTIRHVDEICRMFPNEPTDHFITQFGFDKSVPVMWNTEVFFGGRYTLTYQIYVSVDYSRDRIIKTTSEPKFVLVEASRVFNDTPENIGADFSADYKFAESDWKKVVAAGGDFSVIGIIIKTNPVARFDEYVHAARNGRLEVKRGD